MPRRIPPVGKPLIVERPVISDAITVEEKNLVINVSVVRGRNDTVHADQDAMNGSVEVNAVHIPAKKSRVAPQ